VITKVPPEVRSRLFRAMDALQARADELYSNLPSEVKASHLRLLADQLLEGAAESLMEAPDAMPEEQLKEAIAELSAFVHSYLASLARPSN
jgi:hypothetical protein